MLIPVRIAQFHFVPIAQLILHRVQNAKQDTAHLMGYLIVDRVLAVLHANLTTGTIVRAASVENTYLL